MYVNIIDTSILCNILDLPFMSQNRSAVIDELAALQQDKQQILILPLASIIETGNHIAHIADGNIRRNRAEKMAELIKKTVNDEAPWTYYGKEFEREDLLEISKSVVDHAVMKVGVGDLSIIQVYKKYKENVPAIGSIRIWSLDHHLQAYFEEMPSIRRRRDR
ncbi:hypothetical protein HQN87_16380 [Paenibacillus tritici]|uniref:PIN domain-containing protein n=1 Tax=Paenibacillus tritici TaxID=1873425 RepID=A0ABX2DQF4_9BACL|nr:hypothetical protein [Paenibacillus tritici]NQX46916.1 hypothetical protein [Paenibacillus tritici]QUL55229.1 hypothetical protein KDC22_01145 [Paenibacillus tritici]